MDEWRGRTAIDAVEPTGVHEAVQLDGPVWLLGDVRDQAEARGPVEVAAERVR